MRAMHSGSYRNIIHHSYNQLNHPNFLHYTSIYSFSQSQTSLPGYEKPLPLDVKTGKLKREFGNEERDSLRKRNQKFRRQITHARRNMPRELLFGNAATRMMNKMAKGGNQKRLQRELVNHLYALKLNSFRLPFMEIEGDAVSDGAAPKRQIKLTRRLKSGSSWNSRQKKKKVMSWEDQFKPSTKNNRSR